MNAAAGKFAFAMRWVTLALLPVLEESLNTLSSLFAFKAWANAELLEVMKGVDAAVHEAALRTATRTLNHTHVVDRIFQAHLQGREHGYTATNTPETPSLDQLGQSVSAVDAWYRDYAATIAPSRLADEVTFTFTDGDAGRMTREEILMHVLAHGGYHRGAIGQVLRGIGTSPPRELYTRFLHATEKGRRERS